MTDTSTWDFNCIVLDEKLNFKNHTFFVSVSPNARIQTLFEAIQRRPGASDVLLTPIVLLWRPVKEDISASATKLEMTTVISRFTFPDVTREVQTKNEDVEELNMLLPVSTYWQTSPNPNCLHIIVICDTQDMASVVRKRKYEDEGIEQLRNKCGKTSPSTMSQPENFREVVGPGQPIGLNRPFEYNTIPLPLLHPAFATFKDRCREAPSTKALKCLNELSESACAWYGTETQRRDIITRVLQRNLGIQLYAEKVFGTEYMTDGNLAVFVMPALIRECRDEKGTAINQAILYWVQWLLSVHKERPNVETCFPCVLMVDMGSHINFYGVVWDGQRARAEPITRGLDLATNFMERRDRDELASVFDALLDAITEITAHYVSIQNTNSWDNDRRQYPFLSSFVENKKIFRLTYNGRLDADKLVFCAIADDSHSAPQRCIVKFVQRYSSAAHEHLAKLGMAPRIRACIPISADWIAIVMDLLDHPSFARQKTEMTIEQQAKVRFRVQTIVETLHQGGFVHGDIRDANLLVDPETLRTNNVTVYLIDFDWAGPIEQARYPADVNTETMKRPEGVKGGGVILKQHDLEMVDYL